MLMVVISPSKGQDFESPAPTGQFTQPEALSESRKLIKELRKIDSASLQELMSISPKLGNATPIEPDLATAHEAARLDPQALAALIETYPCQLKFVIESAADIAEIQELLRRLPPVANERVLLMPQATTPEQLMARAAPALTTLSTLAALAVLAVLVFHILLFYEYESDFSGSIDSYGSCDFVLIRYVQFS